MQAGEAERTLLEIERVRRSTRRALHPLWFGNLVVGVFFVGATLTSAVASGPALPIAFWAIGVPLGLFLIVDSEMRLEREIGAEARGVDPSLGILLAIVAGVVVVNQLTDSGVAWAYPVAAGWLAIGALYRDAPMTAAAIALALIATAISVVDPSTPGLWTQLAMGLLLIAAALAERAQDRA